MISLISYFLEFVIYEVFIYKNKYILRNLHKNIIIYIKLLSKRQKITTICTNSA